MSNALAIYLQQLAIIVFLVAVGFLLAAYSDDDNGPRSA